MCFLTKNANLNELKFSQMSVTLISTLPFDFRMIFSFAVLYGVSLIGKVSQSAKSILTSAPLYIFPKAISKLIFSLVQSHSFFDV